MVISNARAIGFGDGIARFVPDLEKTRHGIKHLISCGVVALADAGGGAVDSMDCIHSGISAHKVCRRLYARLLGA
jgi:hypothetical protein